MNKLIFKVIPKKDDSIITQIKEINKLPCRINLDLKNSCVTVENVNDNMINQVTEFINNYYTVSNVTIDNISENSDNDVNSSEKSPTIIKPQSENDLIIKKVEFRDNYIEQLINKFLRSAYWAIYVKKASTRDVANSLTTAITELSFNINKNNPVKFEIGDIVSCYYGTHLDCELCHSTAFAIVCNILNENLVCLVPIELYYSPTINYLSFTTPADIICDKFNKGKVLLDKARYIGSVRIKEVVGKTTPRFFSVVLDSIASTFDFTPLANYCEEEKNKQPIKKTEKELLLEVIGEPLKNLNKDKPIEEQINDFLTQIGMSTEKLVTQSFKIACNTKKINYENILKALSELNPDIKINVMKSSLQNVFKNWLSNYPLLAKEHPNISFMALLKVWSKNVR